MSETKRRGETKEHMDKIKTHTFVRVLDLEGSCSTVEHTVIIASCLQELNPNDTPQPGEQP